MSKNEIIVQIESELDKIVKLQDELSKADTGHDRGIRNRLIRSRQYMFELINELK